jgi:hypothetical protein
MCHPTCTSSAECTSGCCIQLTGTDRKICQPEGPAC